MNDSARADAPHPGMGPRTFVAFVAAVMAINSLGVDIMLPALADIGRDLGAHGNDIQWVISAFGFGFGSAQLVYGPLTDRFGRKPILLASIALFFATSILAGVIDSFPAMIVARFLQGTASAGTRVVVTSIVRDSYSGRSMARVMSLAFIVFMGVPILAPSLGQLIQLVSSWHWIFFFLAGFGGMVLVWAILRLPETLRIEDRRKIAPKEIISAARIVLTERCSIGYTMATTLMMGSLFGFINSSQQIIADTFGRPELFALIFGAPAGAMAIGSFGNSRIVERIGTRRLSQGALLAFIVLALAHLLVAANGLETIWTFTIFQSLIMAAFAMTGPNFGAMAMEPVGHLAGTASSIQGFVSAVGAAAFGATIGQSFDGTTVPLTAGIMIIGVATLIVVTITERGRLFQPHHAPLAERKT